MTTFLRLRLRAAVVAMLVAALVSSLALGAAAQTTEEQRLDQTQDRIEQVRAELDAAKDRQSRDAASLAKAEQQLAVVTEALAAAEQAVARQEQAVQDAKATLAKLEDREQRQRDIMSARLVTLYKQGTTVEFAPILTSDNPAQALERTALVDAVARSDRRSFEQVTITQTAIDAQRRQLLVEEDALERVASKRREIVALAEELRNDRALVLAASSNRVDTLQAQEAHLEADAAELAAIARRAARAQTASRSSTVSPAPTVDKAVSGGWTWPASGPVTSEFGYRWGRLHAGLDIGAPTGAPIWAAAAGVVSYAGTMGGYGNIILIDHGGGITTAYAHQTSFVVGVGANVAAGQQIGRVGSTGNSTGPHLHFEVRVGGSPQNPRSYLP